MIIKSQNTHNLPAVVSQQLGNYWESEDHNPHSKNQQKEKLTKKYALNDVKISFKYEG